MPCRLCMPWPASVAHRPPPTQQVHPTLVAGPCTDRWLNTLHVLHAPTPCLAYAPTSCRCQPCRYASHSVHAGQAPEFEAQRQGCGRWPADRGHLVSPTCSNAAYHPAPCLLPSRVSLAQLQSTRAFKLCALVAHTSMPSPAPPLQQFPPDPPHCIHRHRRARIRGSPGGG